MEPLPPRGPARNRVGLAWGRLEPTSFSYIHLVPCQTSAEPAAETRHSG